MSVNGRPFKPDPTSYQMTGIPCGNPKRYKSRAVLRLVPDSNIPFEDQQIGIPGAGTETEAEKEFKKLLDQQMNTTASAIDKKVNFVTSAKEVLGTAAGYMTLQRFQQISEQDKRTNQLRTIGLTEMQISTTLLNEGYTEQPSKKRKAHPDFIDASTRNLEELNNQRNLDREIIEREGPQMSRHMLQLENALLQGKSHLPLAHVYVNGEKRFKEELEKVKAQGGSINDILIPEESPIFNKSLSKSPETGSPKSDTGSPKSDAVKTPPESVVDAPVIIKQKIEALAEDKIASSRLSEEEFKKQFPNYTKGEDSKVLYVKQMEKSATIEDLVSLFGRFQKDGKEKIAYKMMEGRMKGQAFVTFSDITTAKEALDLVNGYLLKGKALNISFAKQK